jgi:hypothetical protein
MKTQILKEHSIPFYFKNDQLFASNEDGSGNYTNITKYSLHKLYKFLGY